MSLCIALHDDPQMQMGKDEVVELDPEKLAQGFCIFCTFVFCEKKRDEIVELYQKKLAQSCCIFLYFCIF